MDAQQSQRVTEHHIELRTMRSGEQKAFIVGTRVSVENIYVCHELHGMTPDAIVASYPHLNLSKVHAALAYYYEHAEEIRNQMKREEAFADKLAFQRGPTRFTALRDKLQGGKAVHDDPLSSR